ncbi:MAG: hypothetical protein JWN72_1440 [Thermoleophilia bacterium]|nr:hypothetical protein [Thermoleophilia bacterium]
MAVQVHELFKRTFGGSIFRTTTTGMKDGLFPELTAVNTHRISSPINPFNDSWMKFDTTRKVTASSSGGDDGLSAAVAGIENLGRKHGFDNVHLGEHSGEHLLVYNSADFLGTGMKFDAPVASEIELAARRVSDYARGPRHPDGW